MPRTNVVRFGTLAATSAVTIFALAAVAYGGGQQIPDAPSGSSAGKQLPPPSVKPDKDGKVRLSDAQWAKLLPADVYNITREAGTEPAFSHPYAELHEKGTYICADCGQVLFTSDTKFDSGTGWPSFWAPIRRSAVSELPDHSYGMDRIEVRCSRCGAHLGHVFDDGPKPTGLRFCMNGLALKFIPATAPKPSAAPKERP